jgi:hypothetical protein
MPVQVVAVGKRFQEMQKLPGERVPGRMSQQVGMVTHPACRAQQATLRWARQRPLIMSPEPPAPAPPPAPPPGPASVSNKHHFVIYGCGALLTLLLLIVLTVAVTIWWIQRPIKPVVLSPKERAVVDQKVQRLEAANPQSPSAGRRSTVPAPERNLDHSPAGPGINTAEDDGKNLRIYVPGSKTLKLTEREINGLLNANTDLGKTVRLEFAQDAINAYVAVRIPDDFPVGGGRMFRARGRFRVSIGNGGKPYAILEDVTVFGISLPKAWLGGIKGENLISDAVAGNSQSPIMRGIKSLRVEPGALVMELDD